MTVHEQRQRQQVRIGTETIIDWTKTFRKGTETFRVGTETVGVSTETVRVGTETVKVGTIRLSEKVRDNNSTDREN